IGRRTSSLKGISRLSELDRLIFPSGSKDLPEKELLYDLENRISGRAVSSIISIVECFSKPPKFLSLLIRGYEYTDLKSALVSSIGGDKKPPAFTDIGRFRTVHFEAWPNIPDMLLGTEFQFLLDKNGVLYKDLGTIALHTLLDRHYYEALWASLNELPGSDKRAAEKILADEIILHNICWTLRLRKFYWMSAEEVKLHLVYIPGFKSKGHSFADDALGCLEFPLDNYQAWTAWKWKDFLNPDSGSSWLVDPRYFQNASSRYLYNEARQYFRQHPFSLDTIFCFIKLKQFEEDVLTSNAEGLGLGMASGDVLSLLGIDNA
ncbi:MAG: V-type ATPase subunit, partial [Treponema sp.]|nr:V-type ATPase subunit [Treponema sp.]